VVRLVLSYLKPHKGPLAIVVAQGIVQAFASLYLPDLNAKIINVGIAHADIGYILRYGGLMLLVVAVAAVAAVFGAYWSARVAMSVGRDMRGDVFRKVQTFSQNEINHFSTASLITRNTNDILQVQTMLVTLMGMMLLAPLFLVGGIIMALRQDLQLSWTIVGMVPLLVIVLVIVMVKLNPLFKRYQLKLDLVNQITRETLSGIRVIRAFARIDDEQRRFDEVNLEVADVGLKTLRAFAVVMPVVFIVVNVGTAVVTLFGGYRVAAGMPVGNLVAFLQYIGQILVALTMGTMLMAILPRASASLERLMKVLDAQPTIHDPEQPAALTSSNGKGPGLVEFTDVEFRYPGAETPVLSGITFVARPGQTTAIIGGTGSGKSTLVSLIPRFYDVTGGSIKIDGQDIREITREDLWSRLGFIPQKAFLFMGTIASNLRYGSQSATDDELWHALSIAQASDFVEDMEGGLDADIAQGGSNVSGGQRQRLAIARAIVKNAPVYIFDDSFSALDFKTDAMLRAALKDEMAGAAVLIVAQRVSTIMNADQIVVLDRGAIAGLGTHRELMESCPTYQEIVYSQLSEEEVA
jgi:ATP-binding cassette subfamily B protein